MTDLSQIEPHAEIIGADGVHVGTLDEIVGDRLKLTKMDSADGRHHYIHVGLIAGVEGHKVRLSAIGELAVSFERTDDEAAAEERLEEGLEETFPASDPVSAKHIS
jgi:hypothetical protein